MMYPRVALVASPDFDAEVRCDLNADTTWPDGDAFSLGAPPLIGDPGGIGASYDFRTLSFNLAIEDGERRALAKQSELARELMRDEHWLLFQLSPEASPVWFRCVRSSPGEVSMATVYLDQPSSLWMVAVSLVAYPFAYGEEVQQGLRLSNDPTVGGVAVVLEDAVGDAPAPLVISGIDADGTIFRPLVAVTPLSEWAGVQVWKPTPTDAAWSTTGSYVTDPLATGGSALRLKIDGSNNGAHDIAEALVTTTQAGTYRLFARVRGVTAGSSLAGSGQAALNPVTTRLPPTGNLPVSPNYFYADLGLYTFPMGNAPLGPGYTLAPGDTAAVALAITNGGSTASLRVDFVVAIPVDLFESVGESRMLTLANNALLGMRIDGEKGRVGPIPGPTPILPRTPDRIEGGFPLIHPGAVNVMHLLTRVQGDDVPMTDAAEPLGSTVALNIRYRPRWLFLAS